MKKKISTGLICLALGAAVPCAGAAGFTEGLGSAFQSLRETARAPAAGRNPASGIAPLAAWGLNGRVNGAEVELQIYPNGVFGKANGQEVRLQVYVNAVVGRANGQEFELRGWGALNLGQALDALVLNLPAPVLGRAMSRQ